MLRRIWQWLKRFFQRLFGSKHPSPQLRRHTVEPPKQLTNAEYEALFLELLAGVNDGWSRGRVKGFLDANKITQAGLVEWLRRFGERLRLSSGENRELGSRMVGLGELGVGEVGEVAGEIGMRLVGRGGETNRRGAEGAEEREEGEAESITLDELFVRLQQDAGLVQQLAQQLGIETDDPQVIIQALINQFGADGDSTTDEAETYFNQGNEQCWAGNFEEAIASFDKAIEFKPDYHEAWYNRGVALCDLGQFEDAIASYDKAIQIKPNFYEAWYNRGGNQLNNLGRYEEAITSYNKAVEFKPDSHEAWSNRGVALSNLGRYEEAIGSFDKAVEIKPDYHDAWFNRGSQLNDLGRYEEAIASFDKAVEFKPNYHEAWFKWGVALFNLGRYEEAIASFDKAVEFKPNYHEAWYNRGVALDNLGRLEDAIASYDKAVEFKPNYHEAWYNRGVALGKLGRYEEAIASFDKAVEFKPDKHDAWFSRGLTLFYLGRDEEAIASYDKAIEFKLDLYEAWYNRGLTLDKLGRDEEAITSYDKAIEFKLDLYEAWHNRGLTLDNLGQMEDAIASFDKAIEFKPDYHEAWHNRGLTLDNLGQMEDAIASYDRTIEIKPDLEEAWNNRGNVLGKLGRFEDAIASHDKALEFKPDNYSTWINRGITAGNSISCDPLLAFMSAIARQNPNLNQRGYEGQLASFKEGLKYCHQHTHPEGWGMLHQTIGKTHYFQGRIDSRPRSYWHKAVNSYNEALKTLTEADFPELHVQVLQDLVRVLLDLGETAKAEELQRRGTDLSRRLLDECKSPEKKKQLALKFAPFQQLTVDLAVQSGEVLQALELAEQGKNACLAWLLDAGSDESPAWEEMKQLLNPTTAIVYWHLSPAALHTFILKHDASSPILISPPSFASGVGGDFQSDESEVPAAARRLHEFENWVKEWNEQYASYCQGRDKQAEEENNWRDNLPQMLRRLANILDISAIVTAVNPELIQNLILIPHRDLHRFPLHALFADNFTITYLPSAQIGLSLLALRNSRTDGAPLATNGTKNTLFPYTLTPLHPYTPVFLNVQPTKLLLSVEAPDSQYAEEKQLPPLLDAEIESCVITQWFANCRRFPGDTATKAKVTDELTSGYSYFHFTGHGTYNFYNPKESALALSGRDTLTLEDICQFNLSHYELVSLSACETAVTGNQTISTEYVGLVSGFVRQGVAHVVSTLWRVESVSSALFMMEFYRQLNRGVEPTTALRQTQIWLATVKYSELVQWYKDIAAEIAARDYLCAEDLTDKAKIIEYDVDKINSFVPPYAHPYFWGSFIITGTL